MKIMAAFVLQPGSKIGLDSIMNAGVIVDHDCIVGKNCHLAPGVTLSGGVHVNNVVYIGTCSSVIQNKIISADTLIAAASDVYCDVLENVTYIQSRQETLLPNRR
jgi:acyl-[acyl carrier protein]--UDP-N-acetylglucosamine O-acyltransferase